MKPAWRRAGASIPTAALADRQTAARALETHALTHGADIAGRPELEAFGSLGVALHYLHNRWITHVGVAVDPDLEDDGSDPIGAIWRAWRRVALDHPGLARILVHHGVEAEIVEADGRHRELIASALRCEPDQLPGFGAPVWVEPGFVVLSRRDLATVIR